MLLAIDTSGQQTSVVVASSSKKLQNIFSIQQSANSHSTALGQVVQDLLNNNSLAAGNIRAVILGSGPGSFTGLRIGFAFAKGFALASSIPILPLSSLSAMAWQFRSVSNKILAISDARREQFFAASYTQSAKGFLPEGEASIITLPELEQWRGSNQDGIVVSNDANIVKVLGLEHEASNLAVSLSELAIERDCLATPPGKSNQELQARILSNLASISPIYLRKVAALTIEERGVGLRS